MILCVLIVTFSPKSKMVCFESELFFNDIDSNTPHFSFNLIPLSLFTQTLPPQKNWGGILIRKQIK